MKAAVVVVVAALFVAQLTLANSAPSPKGELDCSSLDPALVQEVLEHQSDVDAIIQFVVNGEYKRRTYDDLAQFTDTFGPRMTSTTALEESIDWILNTAALEGFDDVHAEDVQVPKWVRNSESATMLEPRVQKLSMLGLWASVGTPPEGITAEVVAVTSFEELEQVADQVPGKIVVYNQPFESFSQSAGYQTQGPSEASKLGAVAVLVRSLTDFSIGSNHAGIQYDADGVDKIPGASITVESAQMIHRLYTSGKTVKINLVMGAENLAAVTSRNTIIDLHGTERPEDVVVISGHIDSWDVGAGVMDDAGGSFISYHANVVLKRLGLRARRTVRTIWFTGEEQGMLGGDDYFNRHKNMSRNFQLLMESDGGTFSADGIGFSGSDTATCIMQEIVKLTAAINSTQLLTSGGGQDIELWPSLGVPIGSLYSEGPHYLWFHHSEGDSMEVEDPDTLDTITALWASVAYVAADMSVNFQDV